MITLNPEAEVRKPCKSCAVVNYCCMQSLLLHLCLVKLLALLQVFVSKGFSDVKNVTGGIHAYSVGVDPSVPVY